eukprot:GHUV01037073.1.p1 GENE.GHUV01037073.1~~GHUV01037073.1.p1  ORF type:complete len:154 (-),score=31.12 GHUV01037073.1:186-647(-)
MPEHETTLPRCLLMQECILGVLSASNHCPLCRGTVDTSGLRAPGKNNESTPVVVKKTKRRRSSGSEGEESEYEDGTLDQQPQLQQQQSSDPNVSGCCALVTLVVLVRQRDAVTFTVGVGLSSGTSQGTSDDADRGELSMMRSVTSSNGTTAPD